jgi:hypothetical protein
LDGKQEIGMYFPDGKTFDSKAFAKDLGTGIADARLFLGSDIKTATDAYNIELAKRIGYPMFTPYKEAQKRAAQRNQARKPSAILEEIEGMFGAPELTAGGSDSIIED